MCIRDSLSYLRPGAPFMKIAHKVGIAAATVLFLTISLLSLLQVSQVRETLRSQVE